MNKRELNRQLARTAGGQDLWPRKSAAHRMRQQGFFPYDPEWARESIKRGFRGALAGPVSKLP